MDLRDLFKQYKEFLGKEVTVQGWIRNHRKQKELGFIDFFDGTYFTSVQLVYDKSLADFDEIQKLHIGSAISVTGKVVESQREEQAFEIEVKEIVLEGDCPEDYPIQPKRHTREFLREQAYLRPRTNLFQATFKIRSIAAYAIHNYFQEHGYLYLHTPLITGSDCEGAGEMFQVTTLDLEKGIKDVDYKDDFFGKKTGLTVSGQLQAEPFALAFKRCYTFGPTFRAERSYTNRHAAEFWMVEPEIAFADLHDDMDLQEDMIKYVINDVLEKCPEELAFFNNFVDKGLIDRLKHIVSSDFARISYTEAVEILEKHKDEFQFPVYWGADLQTEHERYLTEQVFKKPTFVTDYPKEIKAFYMRLNDDGKTVAAADLLVPAVGEICGGSQREERLDLLLDRMKELGLKEEDYWWYLDLRKYGGVKHAGFGLGFERLIMYLTGMQNIRDVIPFPRTTGTAEF